MKKTIFILFFFIILFSISGNEKIVDLKFKIEGIGKLFPVDEKGIMDYGFYKYDFFKRTFNPEDETIEPLYGKVNLDLIKKLADYNKKIILDSLLIGLGFGFGTFFTIRGTLILYDILVLNVPDYNSPYTRLSIALNSITLACGAIEFILGIVAIGLIIYNGYHFTKIKKEIIALLNNEPALIKTENMKIKFVLNLGIGSN